MPTGVLSLSVSATLLPWSVMNGFINGSGIVNSVTNGKTANTRGCMNIFGMGADVEKEV